MTRFETVSSSENDLGSMFELYTKAKRLKDNIEKIDFRISDRFQIERWFLPFMKEWLTLSEKKLMEWALSSLKVENVSLFFLVINCYSESTKSLMNYFQC